MSTKSLYEIESPLFGVILHKFDDIVEHIIFLAGAEQRWLNCQQIIEIMFCHVVLIFQHLFEHAIGWVLCFVLLSFLLLFMINEYFDFPHNVLQ